MVAHTLVVVDELAETAAANPKRLEMIVEKMYVPFLKSAASSGNQGMKLVQNHSTLKQSVIQEGKSLLNSDIRSTRDTCDVGNGEDEINDRYLLVLKKRQRWQSCWKTLRGHNNRTL